MGEQTTAPSAHEVIAVEPVIRRVVAARAANPADIDDLVQDCLERLLAARDRLAPEAVLPYAVVTARNLVSSHARNARRRAAVLQRIIDTSEPDRPEDVLLTEEARRAMTAALAQLSAQERSALLAYYDDDSQAPAAPAQSRSALRVRMSRTRAKLRLEYLLAFRHLDLPSPQCRKVLLAVSGGDIRRQRELEAGQHLLDCQTCAVLSEPLERRSVALTALAVPVAVAVWVLRLARAHPVQTAASVAVGSAAIAAAVILGSKTPVRPAPAVPARVSSSPSPRPTVRVISHLSIGGQPMSDTQAAQSIRSLVGDAADASGVNVVAAVTRNGFWIGSDQGRLWVQLAGPLRLLRIRAGDRVRFTGTVVGNPPSYPADAGVTNDGGAELLARQGAHLVVSTTKITVERGP